MCVFARACVTRACAIKQVGARRRKFFSDCAYSFRFLRTRFFSIGVVRCVYSHTHTVYFCISVCLCVCERERVCVHLPPPHSAFLYFCARASSARAL